MKDSSPKVPSPYVVKTCFHCGNNTQMQKMSQHRLPIDSPGVPPHTIFWNLLLCPVCKKVTLEQYTLYENLTSKEEILYPTITSHLSIPKNILSSYESALKTRNIDGALCAIALRRTLETACKDKGELSGDLFNKLKNLADKGMLPPILSEMASVLRKIGNDAAHADNTEFPPQLVNSLIEFTENILEYLYVLPANLTEIQSKFRFMK